MEQFPTIDKKSRFYKNCKEQRKRNAKICQDCPFRVGIEEQEGIAQDSISEKLRRHLIEKHGGKDV